MRIVLADDHDLVRDSLVTLISHYSTGSEVIGVDCLDAALSALRRGPRYDLAILDLHMPGMNGLGGLKKLITEWPDLPVALMSGAAHSSDIEAALAMGARGYLPKTMAGRGLVQALELILAGEIFLPSNTLRSNPGRIEGDTPDRGLNLTERERQVLQHLKEGMANKEIAQRLSIHEATVKLHLRTLSKKLGARNRTDLVLKAIQLGLVE
jgi:two-component system, NarL family, nitrate/nitrite response regulator NarL